MITSPISGVPTKFTYIKVINEPTQVKGYRFRVTHYYFAPEGEEHDTDKYLEPFSNPDLNVKRDFAIYRHRAGMLSPNQIKLIIKNSRLSLRELATITGLSSATLSNLARGDCLQNRQQDNVLRASSNRNYLRRIAKNQSRVLKANFSTAQFNHIFRQLAI